jgi:hypothetical protein
MLVRHLNEMSVSLVASAKGDLDALERIRAGVTGYQGEAGERDFLLAAIDRLTDELNKRITESRE